MRVYGLDFTSNPTKAKRLTLAVCSLDGVTLKVERLERLESKKDGDFVQFENWLNGKGKWSEEKQWVAGIDFPFGMPIETVNHFCWFSDPSQEQSWKAYMKQITHMYSTPYDFRECIEGWRHTAKLGKSGDPMRVRISRLTDKLANSGSPMNYFPPPVCPMFYQGARRLASLEESISIIPVRSVQAERVIIEAYPRLVVDVFISSKEHYKEKSTKKGENKKNQEELRELDNKARLANRKGILAGLSSSDDEGRMMKRYGHHLAISEDLALECVQDHDGDKLDSVLCAVQAAWAHKAVNHGVPGFTVNVLQDQIRLEGWITDPYLLERLANGES
jgi:hypothetical protein